MTFLALRFTEVLPAEESVTYLLTEVASVEAAQVCWCPVAL